MALPTSTIVMAVITAVPFGLAINDMAQGTSGYDLAGDAQSIDDDEGERYSRAQREYEAREERRRVELRTALDKLIPVANKAVLETPGFRVGAAPPDQDEQDELEDLAHAVFRATKNLDGTLKTLTISFPQHRRDENICHLLSKRLDEAWGESSHTYESGDTLEHWVSTSARQRATFVEPDDGERCRLTIEGFATVPDFVNKTEASTVPLWAVGQPAAKLTARLGDNAYSDATQIRWTALGVGEGLGETELYARVVKGKIVTVSAKFQTSERSIGALAEQLVNELGEPTDTDPVVWQKAKVSLATVDDTAGTYLLVAGESIPSASDDE